VEHSLAVSSFVESWSLSSEGFRDQGVLICSLTLCVAQWLERRSLAGRLSLIYAWSMWV